MKPTDLRVNNLLKDEVSGAWLIVEELTKETIITEVINRSFYPLPDGWKLSPIPLTEEILLNAGFEKIPDKFHKGRYEKVGKNIYHFFYNPEYNSDNCGVMGIYHPAFEQIDSAGNTEKHGAVLANFSWGIKYVHQLQNLWFTVTGEELEINL